MATCNLGTKEAEAGDLQSKLGILTQRIQIENNQQRFQTTTSGLHMKVHMYMKTYTHTHTPSYIIPLLKTKTALSLIFSSHTKLALWNPCVSYPKLRQP